MCRLGAFVLSIAVALSACGSKKPPVAGPVAVTPALRLAAADALVASGCLDCLIDAHRRYDALRADPSIGSRATAEAIRTALLIAVREHELGLLDSGQLITARQLLDASPLLTPE